MEIAIIIILLLFAYLVMKPEPKPKSKEQKQEEIKEEYKQKLLKELSFIEGREAQLKKKSELLKAYAAELHRNLFFDEEETKAFINELSQFEARQS